MDEAEDDEKMFKNEVVIEFEQNEKYIFHTSNNVRPLIISAGKKVKN